MDVGFYRKDILSSDFESLYRLMLGGKVAFVDRVVALWRQHGANASATSSYGALIANLDVFEGPHQRALELGCLSTKDADSWLHQRLARYLLSALWRVRRGSLPVGHAAGLARHLVARYPKLLYHLPAMALCAAGDARRTRAPSA